MLKEAFILQTDCMLKRKKALKIILLRYVCIIREGTAFTIETSKCAYVQVHLRSLWKVKSLYYQKIVPGILSY